MKKILLAISLTFPAFAISAQGLENIIVERYYVSDANDATATNGGILPVGSVTYRIFVDLAPGYILQSIYGDPDNSHELRIETTTEFFNNSDRGSITANGIEDNRLRDNTVMLDSWISMGAASAGNMGILKQDDTNGSVGNADGFLQNDDPLAGIPVATSDGLISVAPPQLFVANIDQELTVFNDATTGRLFSTTDGLWACIAGATGPTEENRVLIAQITTNGVLSFKLNLQIRRQSDFLVENYVQSNPVGNEILCEKCTFQGTLNVIPQINLTSPVNGSGFSTGDPVSIEATASDEDGTIDLVEFFINGEKIGEDVSEPYQFTWTAVYGTASVTAVVTDNLGAKDTSDIVNIVVENDVNLFPTVEITSPENNSSFEPGDVLNVTAEALDEDGTIILVELFVNGVKVTDDATSPYEFQWITVSGPANLTAVATDNDGAKDTSTVISLSIITGLNEYNYEGFNLWVFPNPAKDDIMVEVTGDYQSDEYLYAIMSLEGKIFIRGKEKALNGRFSGKINISSLPNGTYIFGATSSSGKYLAKPFIKYQ